MKRCPRCGSKEVEESEISVDWKCDKCDLIWGWDSLVGHYYYPKWIPGIAFGERIRIPEGCLWAGHTKKVEREEV